MGTHIWNNSPSRRGRRMSIEGPTPPPTVSPPDFPQLPLMPGFPPPPFPFQGFPPGLGPKLEPSDIPSGIQQAAQAAVAAAMNVAGNSPLSGDNKMPPLPFSSQQFGDILRSQMAAAAAVIHQSKTSNGELDLSTQRTPPSSTAAMDVVPTSPWMWKSSCQLCSKVCGSPSDLQEHVKTHCAIATASAGGTESLSKTLVA